MLAREPEDTPFQGQPNARPQKNVAAGCDTSEETSARPRAEEQNPGRARVAPRSTRVWAREWGAIAHLQTSATFASPPPGCFRCALRQTLRATCLRPLPPRLTARTPRGCLILPTALCDPPATPFARGARLDATRAVPASYPAALDDAHVDARGCLMGTFRAMLREHPGRLKSGIRARIRTNLINLATKKITCHGLHQARTRAGGLWLGASPPAPQRDLSAVIAVTAFTSPPRPDAVRPRFPTRGFSLHPSFRVLSAFASTDASSRRCRPRACTAPSARVGKDSALACARRDCRLPARSRARSARLAALVPLLRLGSEAGAHSRSPFASMLVGGLSATFPPLGDRFLRLSSRPFSGSQKSAERAIEKSIKGDDDEKTTLPSGKKVSKWDNDLSDFGLPQVRGYAGNQDLGEDLG